MEGAFGVTPEPRREHRPPVPRVSGVGYGPRLPHPGRLVPPFLLTEAAFAFHPGTLGSL